MTEYSAFISGDFLKYSRYFLITIVDYLINTVIYLLNLHTIILTIIIFNRYNSVNLNSMKKTVIYRCFGKRAGDWCEPGAKYVNEAHFGEAV